MNIELDHIDQININRIMAPFQWFGGKGMFVKKILPLLPQGRVYVEPFCGAASVFWHLPKPYPVEVLNDLDGRIVNLFRVLQDPAMFAEFSHRVTWTLYSLDEFRRALTYEGDDPVVRAWAFYVSQNQGFGGKAGTEGCWGRAFVSARGMAGTTSRWRSKMACLGDWHDRLTRVQLDNRDALEVIKYWDSVDTVFYLDPPYVPATRKMGKGDYKHDQEEEFHARLVDLLLGLKGQAVLSGYPTPIYAPLETSGWSVHEWSVACAVAGRSRQHEGRRGKGSGIARFPRTERLWIKRHAVSDGGLSEGAWS